AAGLDARAIGAGRATVVVSAGSTGAFACGPTGTGGGSEPDLRMAPYARMPTPMASAPNNAVAPAMCRRSRIAVVWPLASAGGIGSDDDWRIASDGPTADSASRSDGGVGTA